ncbi:MAG: MoaD/ThiS family protein [Bacteroidota bacterium]
MKVTLRLFSIAKELAGFEEREVEVSPDAKASEVLEILSRLNPQFTGWRGSLRLAVNREYVPGGHLLRPGDEVAIIPPVSGG